MDEPYIFAIGLHSVMSQLVRVRADRVRGLDGDVRIATATYRWGSVEGMDRRLTVVRAGRADVVQVSESQWGTRRLVINYFGA
jgi:hypothetical protein